MGFTASKFFVEGRKISRRPSIAYRPIRPSDLEILQKLHADIFPIRYESEFFYNVVNHRGIISWGAVDRNRPSAQSDELIGFVTVKIVLARESEITDLVRCDSTRSDQSLVYILTLGVVEAYRNFGVASALIREVTRYAKTIPTCRAVYLHVISYNTPAIYLYKKMSFTCVRRLYGFYLIEGQPYDAYLFVYYVNGGQSPCSPLELKAAMQRVSIPNSWVQAPNTIPTKPLGVHGYSNVAQMGSPSASPSFEWFTSSPIKELAICAVNFVRTSLKSVTSRLWRYDVKKPWRWTTCKENCGFVTPSKSKRDLIDEGSNECQCV